MAKKASDGEVNKSEAIREAFTQNPKISVRELIDTLAQRHIEVKPGLVYLVKGKMKGRRGRRRKIRRDVEQVMGSSGGSGGDALTTIRKVKTLANDVGGMRKLRALIDALSE